MEAVLAFKAGDLADEASLLFACVGIVTDDFVFFPLEFLAGRIMLFSLSSSLMSRLLLLCNPVVMASCFLVGERCSRLFPFPLPCPCPRAEECEVAPANIEFLFCVEA